MRGIAAIAAVACALGGSGAASAQTPCTLEGLHPPVAEIAKFRAAMETSFLFKLLQRRVGAPLSCDGEALDLLKAGAKDFSSPECGIDWSKPVRENGLDAVSYWGPACNCHGRIHYRGKTVIGLSFGMAC